MTNIVLAIDEDEVIEALVRRARWAYLGAFSADITDDGKTIQLHWDYGDMTNVSLHDLLIAYLEKHGVEDPKGN